VLETLEHALARGASIHGEVLGYGRNADAHHITAPVPGGAGAAACMQLALDDAALDASGIGHVNAHGTSTPLNDATEAEAIRKVFGDITPPVTSTKGVTGHMIAGAGAAEAVISLLSLRDGIVPPTANLEQIGDDIGLDVVAGEPRPVERKPVLSNSFGFGGHNATLILGSVDVDAD
jgi:3-oxoacyl-[acyl-carrier-protein] synthase II